MDILPSVTDGKVPAKTWNSEAKFGGKSEPAVKTSLATRPVRIISDACSFAHVRTFEDFAPNRQHETTWALNRGCLLLGYKDE